MVSHTESYLHNATARKPCLEALDARALDHGYAVDFMYVLMCFQANQASQLNKHHTLAAKPVDGNHRNLRHEPPRVRS